MDEEVREKLREEIGDAQKQKQLFEMLIGNAGWKYFAGAIKKQIEVRRNDLELNPLQSLHEVPAKEYLKGEIAALRALMALPKDAIADAEAIIEAASPKEDDEDE